MVSPELSTETAEAELALERLFRLTANRTLQARQTEVVGVEVTRAGYAVLRCLDAHESSSLNEVARECSMDAGTASRQIRALEAIGLVARQSQITDGRAIALSLTTRGRKTYSRIVAFRCRYLAHVLREWSARDREMLTKLVNRLVTDLSGQHN